MCLSILFTAMEKASFRRTWHSALVVKDLDRRVAFLPLSRRLNSVWAKQGDIQISDLNNGCFLVRFREKSDYEIAVTGGPWKLGETYLTVHRWHKGFNPWNANVITTLVWVQLPDLPVEFYHPTAVMRIASRIGTPVRVDRATKEGARTKYARVCVEIDLTKPLLSKYKIEGKRYFIGYEGLNYLCTTCGRFGAPTTRCKCRNTPPVADPMTEVNETINTSEIAKPEEPYGAWMLPKPCYKRWGHVNRNFTDKPLPTAGSDIRDPTMISNPFYALNDDEDEMGNNKEDAEENPIASQTVPSKPPPPIPKSATVTRAVPKGPLRVQGDPPIPAIGGEKSGKIHYHQKGVTSSRTQQHLPAPKANARLSQHEQRNERGNNSLAKGEGNQSPLVPR
ncbi:hypothetical protein LINGRAHAP2_LOCUS31720 [Linum grandiflorum]